MKTHSPTTWTTTGARSIVCLVIGACLFSTACRSCHHDCATAAAGPPAVAAVTVAAPSTSVAVTEPPSGSPAGAVFESPQAAMVAIASSAETGDFDRIKAIFWRDCGDLLDPEDAAVYDDDCIHLAGMIRERLAFDDDADGSGTIAVIGKASWRFPVPIVRRQSGWMFDLAQGQEELLTREIGRNELLTIETLEEYAVAQREYASEGHDGKPRGFAKRFESTEGKRDGLHWKAADGEKGSPIGPLLAAAANESEKDAPAAFNGYRYRMLADGCRIPSMAESRPTVGCAVLAWPAIYGITGVMTFIVDHSGIVFEKDLGPDTNEKVKSIIRFGLGPGWKPSRGPAGEGLPIARR